MNVKITFAPSTTQFGSELYDLTLSFLHQCLGADNQYHDHFSPYSITPPMGGTICDGKLMFPNGAYMEISSVSESFIEDLTKGLINRRATTIGSLHMSGFEVRPITVSKTYDIIKCLTPIVLKKDGAFLTYNASPTLFMENLISQTKKKLVHLGLPTQDIDNFTIEPYQPQYSKDKYIRFKGFVLPTSRLWFIAKGSRDVRRSLCEIGLGNMTGCGFGHITIQKY